jgi:hypothetical protein
MSLENDDLEHQTTRLAEKAQRVALVESNLSKVVSQQGSDVSSFVSLVKENGVVQQQMQDLIVAQVAQQLMTSIVRADRNRDFQISEQEVTELIFHIKSIQGVENIDETELRKVLGSSGKQCLSGIYQMIKDMHAENQNPLAAADAPERAIKSRELNFGATNRRRASVIQVSARGINAASLK